MDDALRATGSGSAPASEPPQRTKSWMVRAVDRGHVWGSIDIWPNRYGLRKYRLVVFPPGIGPAERRWVRLARSWPIWGTALWLILTVVHQGQGDRWTTVGQPTMIYLICGAIVFGFAGDARSRVRTLTVRVLDGHHDATVTAQYARLERLVLALVAADAMRDRGELSVVHHEAVWWTVYDALGQNDRELT